MAKAELQYRPAQNPIVAQQSHGVAIDSPQAGRLNRIGSMIRNSLHMTAQRRAIVDIQHSPKAISQRRQLDRLDGKAIQGQKAPASPNKTGLPDRLKSGIESLSGLSMDSVRVHYNSNQPAQLNALAYAQGTDIHLSPGQEKHLPHEAWHVVQQAQGRVAPLKQLKHGVAVNDHPDLEREADVMGMTASQSTCCNHRSIDAAESTAQTTAPSVLQPVWDLGGLDHETAEKVESMVDSMGTKYILAAFKKLVAADSDVGSRLENLIDAILASSEANQAVISLLIEAYHDGEPHSAADLMADIESDEKVETAHEEYALKLQSQHAQDESASELDVEALIELFSALSISEPIRFFSDVDEGQEEHEVKVVGDKERFDIQVKSNPKPLKEITEAGKWEGVTLSTPIINQLLGLRAQAKLKLYALAGKKNTKHNIVGARTKTNFAAFRKALAAIAAVLSKVKSAAGPALMLPPTSFNGSENFGVNAAPTEGRHVIAKPLSINTASAGSKPTDGRLMKAIRVRAGKDSKSYVQMHLLNDLVFGPGELWNLTPGPKQSNSDMEHKVETPLKSAVLGKGLVIEFEATVDYKNDPITAKDKDINQNPDAYRFNKITIKARQLTFDSNSQKWIPSTTPDADVKNINGVIPWRYGGLEPLTPKPRILSTATTVVDLTAVGIQPAAAKRIWDYVQANNPGPFKGANKQRQLADAVKAYDKEATIPNISSWKATDVFWT